MGVLNGGGSGAMSSADDTMSAAKKDDSQPQLMDIRFSTSKMRSAHIMALDQLIEYQCLKLEKKLGELKKKRQQLQDGGAVTVSLEELISDKLVEAAEVVVAPKDELLQQRRGEYASKTHGKSAGVSENNCIDISGQEEIRMIIDSINKRKAAEEANSKDSNRRVQFTANESDESGGNLQTPRRCATLPEGLGSETKRTCKPCAFFYNKKKGCRNGLSCEFCHHEDHAICTLKQWKKQQKLYSQSGSLSGDRLADVLDPN
ncbi:hypothetical protein BgAZ_101610 [Babesia gibsoni]|uniref:C3H1-type domain-containing protein n=1 Tax=Babesia gibsoni TaxID=33632 RepID=A0AAD8PF39_BABGI|nr:hypothetical protein BgAZ_101610 [Babesia gibsoni]